MRVPVQFKSTDREVYRDFCKHSTEKLSYDEWKNIIYTFNEAFRDHILETGEVGKLPHGFGEFTINKKKRAHEKILPDGTKKINLPIDWKRTKEKGKVIYNFNHHTEGFFFGWMWMKHSARLKFSELWYFKPSRVTSRTLAHYIKSDPKYQNIYCEWSKKTRI